MTDANYTLTAANEAADEARQMFIRLTGTLSTTRNVICPAVSKLYFVSNETTGGQSIVFKTAAGTGITVPNGSRVSLYCDGTNVVSSITLFVGNVTGNLTGNVTGNVTGDVSGNAGTVTNGVYTTGNQTIGGNKSFSGVVGIGANWTVEQDGTGGLLFKNGGTNRMRLSSSGDLVVSGNVTAYGTV
jgi:hypothetical protein